MATFFKDISWAAVISLLLILAACCFLAVFWGTRERQGRKLRIGMFMEREYKDEDEETKELPPDEWPTQHD